MSWNKPTDIEETADKAQGEPGRSQAKKEKGVLKINEVQLKRQMMWWFELYHGRIIMLNPVINIASLIMGEILRVS